MKKYALVIGISNYQDPEITDLSFAADDAREVGQSLQEVCGFDEVRALHSGGKIEPSHVNVVQALHNLAPLLSPEDLFLFYFAGHGIQTKTGARLLTSNSLIRMPELASVSKDVLIDCLSGIECANRALILDACRNDPRKGMGDEDNLLTTGFSRDIMAVAETSVEGVTPATCVLFSCRLGERAYEWPERRHGVFTHYLLDGLRGAASDDRGRITIQGLGRYVEEQVPRWARKTHTPRPQTPWGEQKGSWREIVLAEARRTEAVVREERAGQIEVMKPPVLRIESDPPGAAVKVDGKDVGDTPLDLELAAGEYRVHAEKAGCEPWERRVRFDAAGDAELRIELEEFKGTSEVLKMIKRHKAIRRTELIRNTRKAINSEVLDAIIETLVASNKIEIRMAKLRGSRRASTIYCLKGWKLGANGPEEKCGKRKEPKWKVYSEWPFSAGEARDRQEETADLLDVPVEKTADLGGGIEMELVLIPRGEFMMGSKNGEDNETPVHKVRITKPFYMSRYPVTQDQWEQITGENPSDFEGSGRPVDNVSWEDCQKFVKKLNAKANDLTFDLPTEAEWEYACRAGTDTPFHFGETISTDQANYDGNCTYGDGTEGQYREETTPVGSFSPNAWGLYDMHGNVWEWCADWYDALFYKKSPKDDPQGAAKGDSRVLRGGSWYGEPRNCRSAPRGGSNPTTRYNNGGCRVVLRDFK
ncbi:MAG: SUMF1/EgtB/PvdO family nonheme iron enzyme [bacterium]